MATTVRDADLITKQVLDTKANLQTYMRAVLIEVDGSIWANQDARKVWYRTRDTNQVSSVKNIRVQTRVDLPVLIGFADGGTEREVLGIDPAALALEESDDVLITDHARQHEPGGGDMIWLYPTVLTDLCVYGGSGLTVNVSPGRYPFDGEIKQFPGQANFDISAHQPGGANTHVFVGIYLDSVNALGSVASAAVPLAITPAEPTWPADTFQLVVIDLDDTQTSIAFADIALRKLMWGDVEDGSWPAPGKVKVGREDYDTITAAVAAANAGDLVKVGEGDWDESFTVNKSLSIIGADRQSTTISQSSAVVTMTITGDDVLLKNISIENTFDTAPDTNAILITDCSTIVLDNVFANATNATGNGYAVEITAPASYTRVLVRGDSYCYGSGALGVGLYVSDGTASPDVELWNAKFWGTTDGVNGAVGSSIYLRNPRISNGIGGVATYDGNYQRESDGVIVIGEDLGFLAPDGFSAEAHAFIVKNSSGGAVVTGDVGLIDEAGEYVETTTANLFTAWCVVLVGGANTDDIYVARRGRLIVTLNANCSIGDFLLTSTTAGQASVSSTMRQEVFAVALTANAGGAGGTCEALLLTGTDAIAANFTNNVYGGLTVSDSDFISTIATLPGGAVFTYGAVTSGVEANLVPWVVGLAKLVIHNTTRGDDALILSVVTGTNTVTLTANVPGTWQVGDTVTLRSQTNVAVIGTSYFFDYEMTSGFDALARSFGSLLSVRDTAGANNTIIYHPYETDSGAKRMTIRTQVANVFVDFNMAPIPLIANRYCAAWLASGVATYSMLSRSMYESRAVP